MDEPYYIITTPQYGRDVRKLSRKHPEIIKQLDHMIKILEGDPYNHTKRHRIKKLNDVKRGSGQYRLRSGDYRLRFDIYEHNVVLQVIKPRPKAY